MVKVQQGTPEAPCLGGIAIDVVLQPAPLVRLTALARDVRRSMKEF